MALLGHVADFLLRLAPRKAPTEKGKSCCDEAGAGGVVACTSNFCPTICTTIALLFVPNICTTIALLLKLQSSANSSAN